MAVHSACYRIFLAEAVLGWCRKLVIIKSQRAKEKVLNLSVVKTNLPQATSWKSLFQFAKLAKSPMTSAQISRPSKPDLV
jgi:hypothetical protein